MESNYSAEFGRNTQNSNCACSVLLVQGQLHLQCSADTELIITSPFFNPYLWKLCSAVTSVAGLMFLGLDSSEISTNTTSILHIPILQEPYLVWHIQRSGGPIGMYQIRIHYGLCDGGIMKILGHLFRIEPLMEITSDITQAELDTITVVKLQRPFSSIQISTLLEGMNAFVNATNDRSSGLKIITHTARY